MAVFVVVGAGPVGRETARLLAAGGDEVRLISRRGVAADAGNISGVALDAVDGEALARISASAEAIFMCAMAAYTRWPADFPPIMDGVALAAEKTGARLVVLGNIYAYGEGAALTLTPAASLAPTSVKGLVRARMWERALASKVPAVEVRASDYLGEGAGSLFTLAALPRLLAGEPVSWPGNLDMPHAWTFTKDVARTLVAAARYQGDWARAFLVPSQYATVRDLGARFADLAGAPPPDLRALSRDELRVLAEGDELMREIEDVSYLFNQPWTLEASDTEKLLGISASSLDAMISDTLQTRPST